MHIEEEPSVEGTKQQVVHHRSEGKLRGEALLIIFVFVSYTCEVVIDGLQ